MERNVFRLIFTAILSVSVLLSGCGTSKTNSANSSGSSGHAPTANATDPSSSPAASAEATQAASQSPTPAGSTASSLAEKMSVSWVDAKSDVLSPTDGKPDAIMDGHFHLTLQLPQPVFIESLFIRYSEFGKELRWDWIYDNHLTPAGYNLSVYEQGKLISSASDTGIKKSGQVDWDLFAAGLNNAKGRDTFSFEPGSHFQIELNYTTQSGERKQWSSKITSQ